MLFNIPAEELQKLRQGWYTDAYFTNIVKIMERLGEESYTFQGNCDLKEIDCNSVAIGDLEVEMQLFARRKPLGLVVGIEEALHILRECSGYFDENNNFVNTYNQLEVEAIPEGTLVEYSGNPLAIKPVLKIRGKYRDFARLETPLLGVLTESTRIATNVFEVLQAAKGKDILFFPARFAHYSLQAIHGYAYKKAVDVYNQLSGKNCRSYVSTEDQGRLWGGHGGGTTAHAYIAVFLGDTAETMLQFARILPPSVPRIALVDFHNDCVTDSNIVMESMFREYYSLKKAGKEKEAECYKLYGLRTDTSGNMKDKSIEPLGDPKLDCGVNARLICKMKKAISDSYRTWSWLDEDGLVLAKEWCANIKIVATGGFNKERIADFEQLGVPVDIYGVGSSLLSNCSKCGTNSDYTADIVQVKVNGQWYPLAKEGRKPADNPELRRV